MGAGIIINGIPVIITGVCPIREFPDDKEFCYLINASNIAYELN